MISFPVTNMPHRIALCVCLFVFVNVHFLDKFLELGLLGKCICYFFLDTANFPSIEIVLVCTPGIDFAT